MACAAQGTFVYGSYDAVFGGKYVVTLMPTCSGAPRSIAGVISLAYDIISFRVRIVLNMCRKTMRALLL